MLIIGFFGGILCLALYLPTLEKRARNLYYNRVVWRNPLNEKRFIEIDRWLEGENHFYARLNPKGRARFLNRLFQLLGRWKFEGREGFVPEFKHSSLIAASTVQLTYGLEFPFLNSVSTIVIYPTSFYSRFLDAEVHGLAGSNGTLLLSWEWFEHGRTTEDDGLHLGLHEMAHALHLGIDREIFSDNRTRNYMDEFLEFSWEYFRQNPLLLRSYALTNRHEFFAVAVEYFFERPREFMEQLPEIYLRLCFLLNLNPLNVQHNYELTPEFYEQLKKGRSDYLLPGFNQVRTALPLGAGNFVRFIAFPGVLLYIWVLTQQRQDPFQTHFFFLGGTVAFGLAYNSSLKWIHGLPQKLDAAVNMLAGLGVCGILCAVLHSSSIREVHGETQLLRADGGTIEAPAMKERGISERFFSLDTYRASGFQREEIMENPANYRLVYLKHYSLMGIMEERVYIESVSGSDRFYSRNYFSQDP